MRKGVFFQIVAAALVFTGGVFSLASAGAPCPSSDCNTGNTCSCGGSNAVVCVDKQSASRAVTIDRFPFSEKGTVDKGCYGEEAYNVTITEWPPVGNSVIQLFDLTAKIAAQKAQYLAGAVSFGSLPDVPFNIPITLTGNYIIGECRSCGGCASCPPPRARGGGGGGGSKPGSPNAPIQRR